MLKLMIRIASNFFMSAADGKKAAKVWLLRFIYTHTHTLATLLLSIELLHPELDQLALCQFCLKLKLWLCLFHLC